HRQLGGLPRGCRLPHPRPSLAARGHGRSRPRTGWQAPSRPRLTPPGGEPLMSETVKMPALGESVTEGTVTRWLKSVGETIDVDEPLLEVSTDKVDTEIPSPVAGPIEKILVDEDDDAEGGGGRARVDVAAGSGRDGPGSGGSGAEEPAGAAASGGADSASEEEAPAGEEDEPAEAESAPSSGAPGGGAEGQDVTMPALGESV